MELKPNKDAARHLIEDVLSTYSSQLKGAGLRVTLELPGTERDFEVRLFFWKANNLCDGIEDFVVRDGRLVASADEIRRWLVEGIDDVLAA